MRWGAIRWLLVGLSLFYGTIGVVLALQGAWLVLPFSGLELLALIAAFYVNALGGQQREVISVAPDALRIRRGRRGPQAEWRMHPYWTRVLLVQDPRGWYPSRLLLRSHGRSFEIARELHGRERESLAHELRAVLRDVGRAAGGGELSRPAGVADPGFGERFPATQQVVVTS